MNTDSSNQLILVTGPARSGKSEWAEWLAVQSGLSVSYLATGQVNEMDPEWQERIQQHRNRRPPHWTTVEVPYELSASIQSAPQGQCLLVDSLGTWVSNQLEKDDSAWSRSQNQFLANLDHARNTIILVAEETGWGVVPAYPLGRQFRDRLGGLIRSVGAIAHTVYLVTGGHVLNLSQLGNPLKTLEP